MRISFSRKVIRVHKATAVASDTTLRFTILILFLEFYPGRPGENFPYEQKTKFIPVTEPARLPGSYEEALRCTRTDTFMNKFSNLSALVQFSAQTFLSSCLDSAWFTITSKNTMTLLKLLFELFFCKKNTS